jgi:uncharacterized protein
MQYRKFGKLDWKASVLGFGSMRLPIIDNNQVNVNEPEAIRMIHYAIDHGVNYLDTGYFYHDGNSEKLVGKALQNGYREKIKLVTKLPIMLINSIQDADRMFHEQIERLQTSKLDIYLFHGLNRASWSKAINLELLKWAERKMGQGLFDHIGFSFHDDFTVFKEIVDSYDNWTLSQVQFNYVDVNRQAGIQGVKYAAGKGLAVVVMEPIRGGILSKNPPEVISNIWESAPVYRTQAEWALLWVWNHPEVSIVLSGMSTLEQVIENVAVADRSGTGILKSEELDLLDKIRQAYDGLRPIPCTGCRYCMPCCNGVDIPGIFDLYNDSTAFNTINMGRIRYNGPMEFKENQRADKCLECGDCEEACPQKVSIRTWLKKVHKELSTPEPSFPPRPGM